MIHNIKEIFSLKVLTGRLQEEIASLKEKWDKQITTVSRGQVTKDLELQALRENEEKLKSDLLQRKQDMER